MHNGMQDVSMWNVRKITLKIYINNSVTVNIAFCFLSRTFHCYNGTCTHCAHVTFPCSLCESRLCLPTTAFTEIIDFLEGAR